MTARANATLRSSAAGGIVVNSGGSALPKGGDSWQTMGCGLGVGTGQSAAVWAQVGRTLDGTLGPEFDNRIFLKIKVLARCVAGLDLAFPTAILDFSIVVKSVICVTDKGSFCEAISAAILVFRTRDVLI